MVFKILFLCGFFLAHPPSVLAARQQAAIIIDMPNGRALYARNNVSSITHRERHIFAAPPVAENINKPFIGPDSKLTKTRIGGYLIERAENADSYLMALLKHGWAIQIGVFSNEDDALAQLQEAHNKAPGLIAPTSSARPYTMRYETNGQLYYRAQYRHLDEKAARKACVQLKKSGVPCLALAR